MKRLILTVLLSITTVSAYAGENIITPLFGITTWSDDSGHTARGLPLAFKDSNETTLGVRYLYLFDSGLAVGGDAYLYTKNVSTIQAEDAGVLHTHALIEYFFNSHGDVSPFIGAGIGVTGIGFSGGTLDGDGTGGSSTELNAGVMFRLSTHIGIQVEYKLTSFKADEDIDGYNTNIDTKASSLLMGLTIHF